MPVRPQPGRSRPERRRAGAIALAVIALWTTACLPEVDAPPPSTMPAAAPATTLVPVDMGSPSDIDREPAEFTGPMLDGREVTLRSDDPNVRFVDGEPAEIRRITGLATDGECEQLHTTLEFWLAYADDDPGPDVTGPDVTGPDAGEPDIARAAEVTTSQRASLFGRATYDAIVFVGCT